MLICGCINKDNIESKIYNKSNEGYTLYCPINSQTTYLIDSDGETVHTWESDYNAGLCTYLMDDTNLLRAGNIGNKSFAPGSGGMVEIMDWDGNLVWQYAYSSDTYLQHHDLEALPNGNILMVVWQRKSESEVLEAGRDPNKLNEGELWVDSIVEVKPTSENSGEVVWKWEAWDHLVQDYDPNKNNYGNVSEHPELIDINYTGRGPMAENADWTHVNSVDYNEELDQLILSVHNFNEIWIIDHSTSLEEAAGHTGGKYGRGGDLLYRWGNPQTYGAGNLQDQKLFGQHDAQWIKEGYPGEGNILVFNNGVRRSKDTNYSTVDELKLPVDESGNYIINSDGIYNPIDPIWTYRLPDEYYSRSISGASRLPNGNTLVCSGETGAFLEVDTEGNIVWQYTNPHERKGVFKVHRYYLNLD